MLNNIPDVDVYDSLQSLYNFVSLEFFLNVCTEFTKFSEEIFVITVKGFEPATSCVRDYDQYYYDTNKTCDLSITFPELTEFNEISAVEFI